MEVPKGTRDDNTSALGFAKIAWTAAQRGVEVCRIAPHKQHELRWNASITLKLLLEKHLEIWKHVPVYAW